VDFAVDVDCDHRAAICSWVDCDDSSLHLRAAIVL
jgi:hypothetical protein